MWCDRIFNPLHVVVNKISVDDIDNLKLFKLSEHLQIGPHIQDMKSEINKYHGLVQSIKSLDERKDVKGKDTFSLPEWWRCNSGSLPHGEDQRRAFGDYLELAMQSQYNKRNL